MREERFVKRCVQKILFSLVHESSMDGEQEIQSPLVTSTVYVLLLESNKFYVGYTSLPLEIRYQAHKAGTGAKWTALHRPVSVLAAIPGTTDTENSLTLAMMKKFGFWNVRGGIWCAVDMFISPVELIPYDNPVSLQEEIRAVIEQTQDLKTAMSPFFSRSGKLWTVEEDDDLEASLSSGATILSLATKHGRSKKAIVWRQYLVACKRLASGMDKNDVLKKFNITKPGFDECYKTFQANHQKKISPSRELLMD